MAPKAQKQVKKGKKWKVRCKGNGKKLCKVKLLKKSESKCSDTNRFDKVDFGDERTIYGSGKSRPYLN